MATHTAENIDHLFGGHPQREILYEDEQCIVYEEEVNRQAAVHFLVVPRKVIPRLCDASVQDEKILGHMLLVAKDMAGRLGMSTGYHVMVDENFIKKTLDGIHVFGRALHHMLWPIGPGCRL